MAESNVRVVFLGDAKQLRSALREIDDDTDKLEKTAKKTESGFGNLKVALVGLGIGAGLKAVIGEASDLNETVSKTRTIFGESADAIEAWGDNAAKSLGLSKTEALTAASSFGNLFDQLGIGSEQALKMSTEMVGLAADFASFHNVAGGATEVIEAQTAAFRGEYDSLQRFVPTINAATVEQEALAMTGKKATSELTAQEKALAVNSLMMKNAGDAAGDFSRTSDSLANQQRILGAEFKNVQAELGTRLMPIALQVVGVLTDLVKGFAAMPAPLQNAVLGLGGAAGAFVVIGKSVESLTKAKDAVVPAFEKIRDVMSQTGEDGERSMNKLGKAASAGMGVVAVGAAIMMAREIHKASNSVKLDIDDLAGSTEEDMDRMVDAFLKNMPIVEKWGEKTNIMTQFQEQFREVAESSIDTAQRLRDAMARNGEETTVYDGIIQDVIASTHRREDADKRSKEALDASKDSTDKAASSTDAYKQASKELDDRLKEVSESLKEQHAHLKDADSAINDLMDSTFGLADADAAWNASLRELTDSVAKNGRTVDTHTEAGNRNREALEGVIESGGKWLAKIYEAEGASPRFEGANREIRQSLVDTMTSLGLAGWDVQYYTSIWDQVPREVATNVAITYRITTIKDLLDEMDKTGFLASGGIVTTPLQVVGEEGPELVQLPLGSRVFSNPESKRMMKGGGMVPGGIPTTMSGDGGPPIIVNIYSPKVSSPSDIDNLAFSVGREMVVALRGSV